MDIARAHSAETIADDRVALVEQAARYAAAYLAGVGARPVAPSAEAVAGLADLCGSLPAGSSSPEAVLELLHHHGSPATVVNGGRYFGFVVGGTVPAALGASILVSAWDQNAGMRIQSPTAADLETTAIGWIAELLGLPQGPAAES